MFISMVIFAHECAHVDVVNARLQTKKWFPLSNALQLVQV